MNSYGNAIAFWCAQRQKCIFIHYNSITKILWVFNENVPDPNNKGRQFRRRNVVLVSAYFYSTGIRVPYLTTAPWIRERSVLDNDVWKWESLVFVILSCTSKRCDTLTNRFGFKQNTQTPSSNSSCNFK